MPKTNQEMRNPSQSSNNHFKPMSMLLLVFLFCTLFSFSTATKDNLHDNLVLCLSRKTHTKDHLTKIIYSPNNSSYTHILQDYIRNNRFNTNTTRKPLLIVTPLNESDVQNTIICAKMIGVQLKIRSGGHDFEGTSYWSNVPFIILDMFNLRSINVNIKKGTAWVQSGATLGELYYHISEKSKVHAFPAGVCPTVGVGGHISGGGYGNLLRKYGLSIDNIVDAQIVDVKGRVLDKKAMGDEVFWAIRGGGGASFGVVLSYKLKLVDVPSVVTVFKVTKTIDDNVTNVIYRWQFVANKIDNNVFVRLNLQPIKVNKNNIVTAEFIGLFLGDSNDFLRVINTRFPQLGLSKQDCMEMSWIESVLFWDNINKGTSKNVLLDRKGSPPAFIKLKSDYVKTPIPKNGLKGLWKKLQKFKRTAMALNPYGGKMEEISETAAPFPHRKGVIFKIQYITIWDEAASSKKYEDQTRQLYNYMTPFVSKNPREAFLNYRDLEIGTTDNGENTYNEAKVYGVKFFKGNFERLVKVKTMIDPQNFFRNEQSIPPLPTK